MPQDYRSIARNMPEAGLDRLHTFVIKYVRGLCDRHGIPLYRDKRCKACSANT